MDHVNLHAGSSGDDGALWIIGETTVNTFLTRIRRDPRVAVGIVDFDVRTGNVQHVGIRGGATIQPWDPARAERLLRRYLGSETSKWDPRFQSNLQPSDDRVLVRVNPETMVVRDQSYQPPPHDDEPNLTELGKC